MRQQQKVIVVGAGHNGLIAACYLARAGREVLVLEQSPEPGGGSRTEERLPGYHFETHAVALRADGRRVRFYRSIEATVASIAENDREEAGAYAAFMQVAIPMVQALLPSIRGEAGVAPFSRRFVALVRALRHRPVDMMRDLLGPYDALLTRWLRSDLTRGPVSAFAAHANVGPNVPGGALFAFWQAAYHLFGQWHAKGGSSALIAALVRRLTSYGGQVRCAAPVSRIDAAGGKVRAVILEDGEVIETGAVITAIDPKIALLELLDPPRRESRG